MKTKFSKKLISLLLSLLMVVSTLPMSAITASASTSVTLNVAQFGVVAASGCTGQWNTRLSGNVMNVTNDGGNANTSGGIISFDISSMNKKNIDSANLKIKATSMNNHTPVGIYYTYSTTPSSYVSESGQYTTGGSFGNSTNGNTSTVNYLNTLGSNINNVVGTVAVSNNSENSYNVKSVIQSAVDNDAKVIYFVIMLTQYDGSTGDPWSDSTFDKSNQKLAVTYSDKAFSRTDVTTAKSNITSQEISNAPYSGTANRAANGSYTVSDLTGGDQMQNVLWSYGIDNDSSRYAAGSDDHWGYGTVGYGSVTLLYDGKNQMSFPVTMSAKRTSSWVNSGYKQSPHSMYLNSEYAELKHAWHGYGNSRTYVNSTQYGVNYVNSHTCSNPSYHSLTSKDEEDYYSNTIYLKNADKYVFENNIATIGSTSWNYWFADNEKSTTNGFNQTITCSNDNQRIRIINYKPIYDAIVKGKEIYNTVSANEMNYCPTDLYNFYVAFDKLVSLNPNNYFSTTSTSGNGYTECAKAIAEAEKYIDDATTMPTTSDWRYTHSYTNGQTNSAVKHSMVCSKCGEEVEQDCTWNAGVETTPATCTSTGVKTYTCTKCNGTYVETIPMSEHNWGTWNGTYSSTKHTRQCQDCKKWDDYYECKDYYETIPVKEATCTETGLTEGKRCSVCNQIRVAQTVIPATGHDYGEDFVCKHNCGTSIDISAFTSAVADAEAKLAETDKYTAKSLAALKAVVDSTTITPNVDNQDAVNAKAGEIVTAINALVLDSFSVTLYIVNYDTKETITSKAYSGIRYGTSKDFDASELMPADSYINKWVASDTEKDSLINSSSTKVSYVVYDNTSIYCYVTEKAVDADRKVKVTLIDKSNHVTGIAYVASGSTFSKNGNELTVDGTTLTAPKYPYYQIKEFRLADANTIVTENGYQVTSDIVVTPVYAAEAQIVISTVANDVTINKEVRSSYTAKWDQTITVYNANATAWYANGVLVATGNTYKFQATQSVEITYDTATVTEGKSRIDYAKYESEFGYSRIVVSNCVPAGATIIEQGIKILTSSKENVPSVASSKVIAGTKKFVASRTTDTGLQFMFTLSTDNAVKTIAVVSFVTYTLNGETKTVWSSEGDASATMIYKTNA